MFEAIKDFLTKEAVGFMSKKYPTLPADVQTKVSDAVSSALNLVGDVAAIVVAIRNAPKS